MGIMYVALTDMGNNSLGVKESIECVGAHHPRTLHSTATVQQWPIYPPECQLNAPFASILVSMSRQPYKEPRESPSARTRPNF